MNGLSSKPATPIWKYKTTAINNHAKPIFTQKIRFSIRWVVTVMQSKLPFAFMPTAYKGTEQQTKGEMNLRNPEKVNKKKW